MFSRLPKLALVAALACSIGLHWGLLQTVAWVGMVVSYSQDASLEQAVVKTFDGKHPCALCKEIAKGRRAEKKSASAPAGKNLEYLYKATAFVFSAPSNYWEVRSPEQFFLALTRTPPTPPPKSLRG